MNQREEDREYEMFERMSEPERARYVATKNNNSLLSELRLIRWILVAILLVACIATNSFLQAR